jgi:pyruvate,orthophosphate dikinase
VGALVQMAVRKGQQARPDIETGVCGEHGGDPASVGSSTVPGSTT